MREFFSYIKRKRAELVELGLSPIGFCAHLSDVGRDPRVSSKVQRYLDAARTDEWNYAVSSAYALLMGDDRRKELSAYFTPPGLAQAALAAAVPFLDQVAVPAVLDPACGGGSFLTPVIRHLIKERCKQGVSVREACEISLKAIRGIEIDPDLAALSEILLRNTLKREFSFTPGGTKSVVFCGDALAAPFKKKYDLVIGNPPYGKVRSTSTLASVRSAMRSGSVIPGSVNIMAAKEASPFRARYRATCNSKYEPTLRASPFRIFSRNLLAKRLVLLSTIVATRSRIWRGLRPRSASSADLPGSRI
jgi:adenine-specific DNA-methyltransferase